MNGKQSYKLVSENRAVVTLMGDSFEVAGKAA
jgi:hypothetical protein